MHHKVIIIGAGVSGVSAACELLKSGFTDFIILEASDRIGGRIHTVKFGNFTFIHHSIMSKTSKFKILYE